MPDRPAKARDRDGELASIDALIDRLVPALTAKLGATHLGELEVREGEWRIRLRRPATAGNWNGELRRATDRMARAAAHDAHAGPRPSGGGSSSNGTGAAAAASGLAVSPRHAPRPSHEDETRRVATSPAVGVFRPGARATVGTRVRQGDAVGYIDVLGVREDILSPVDGLVGELLTEAGMAVEYGQELLVIAITTSAGAA